MAKTILSFISIAFFVAVVIVASITANWSIIPISILISSVIILVINFSFKSKINYIWQEKTTQSTAKNISITLIVLAVFCSTNVIAIRYNLSWDLTENQIYTLSPLSQAVVEKLEQPLEILVFDRDTNPNLENLLEKYQNINKNFKFKFINPEKELGLAQQYEIQFLGEIYLKYGNKKQKLNTDPNLAGEPITETQLTSSIEKIQRDRTTNIYLLQGHGEASSQLVERGIAQVVRNLEDKGNIVAELNLASSGKIPDRTDLIIIAGATRKLLTAEVAKLQTYLSTGGNLLLLLSPNTDIGITPLLQEWGIELDNKLVVDGSGAGDVMGFGPGVAIVNNYGNHPITASFANGISIFPESRPLKIIEKTGIKSTPLAITNEQTWAERDLKNEEIAFDPNQDLSGPLNIAIALHRDRPQASRLVIFGSSTFATNGWFEQQLNGDLILNSVNWLIGEEREILTIRPREAANRRINLSSLEAKAIDWLAWRVIPGFALGTAIYLWSRRYLF